MAIRPYQLHHSPFPRPAHNLGCLGCRTFLGYWRARDLGHTGSGVAVRRGCSAAAADAAVGRMDCPAAARRDCSTAVENRGCPPIESTDCSTAVGIAIAERKGCPPVARTDWSRSLLHHHLDRSRLSYRHTRNSIAEIGSGVHRSGK